MRNIEIVGIVTDYTTQRKEGKGITLPAAVAWTRRVNMEKLFSAKKLIDEAIQEIQQRYADDEHSTETKDKSGNTVRSIKPEYLEEYYKAQSDIMVQETDVEIKKVKVEDLGDIVLSDADMDTIAFMLGD